MKPITAKITLTEPEWYLLYLCFINASRVLPSSCSYEVELNILTQLEDGLLTSKNKKTLKRRKKTGDL